MQLIIRIHRLANRLHRTPGGKVPARILEGLIRVIFSAALPSEARIDPTVFLHHSGIGVVINKAAVLSEGCQIGVHVVIGGKTPLLGAAFLGRNVIVHAGAVLVGPISIGDGAVIAANSVVTNDVPSGVVVAGVPARILKENVNNRDYRM